MDDAPSSGNSGPVVEASPVATSDVVLKDPPSPQEAADRAAVEAQWLKFWDVAFGLSEQPEDQWDALISSVSIDPMRASVMESAARRKANNRTNYGIVGHAIFWQFPIEGAGVATVADCQDHSQVGILNNATGEKSVTGAARVNVRGVLVKGSDGTWRVREYTELVGIPCPGL